MMLIVGSVFNRQINHIQLRSEGSTIAQQAGLWRELMPIYVTPIHGVESVAKELLMGINEGGSHINVFELSADTDSPQKLKSFLKSRPANEQSGFLGYPNVSLGELMGCWTLMTLKLLQEKQTREPGKDVAIAKHPVIMIYEAKDSSQIRQDLIGVEALSVWTNNFLPAVALLGSVEARVELLKRFRQVPAETVKVV